MASHPYISGPGNIAQMIGFLRKNFPATVSSDTVKKFQLASNNESYVINALQFIGVIDEEGKRTNRGHEIMVLRDGEFEKEFQELVRSAYSDLFEIRGEDAWTMSKAELTGYFRTADKTSDVIGGRQAGVFQVFRTLAGKEEATETKFRPSTSNVSKAKGSNVSKAKGTKPANTKKQEVISHPVEIPPVKSANKREMSLTVRIEINLPAEGSQETYDNIFRSIKANLIDD
ncbi:DUF5343 domain-containing protein [Rhizobium laguerreae]